MSDTVLPLSDFRSPFYVNVPAHDSKPVLELVAYFKQWKHFIAALVAYLKDLVLAKEFELNLNLQLVGSVQFPGAHDLPYKCLQAVEKLSPVSLVTPTPKSELVKSLATVASNVAVSEFIRPGLAKTKSATSFLKNQTFAHKRTASNPGLKSEATLVKIPSNGSANSSFSTISNVSSVSKVSSASNASNATSNKTINGNNANINHNNIHNNSIHSNHHKPHPVHPQHSGPYAGPPPINLAKFAPKPEIPIDPMAFPPKSLLTNMPQMLVNHHINTYAAQVKLCREISNKLVPRLESLHKNLAIKIKEIRSLLKNESFANPALIKEVSKTGALISAFVESVKRYLGPRPVIKTDNEGDDDDDSESLGDPFLIKLKLDAQLKNQLVNENFIFASYVNLQNISRDLLNYVIKDLNGTTEKLIRLTNADSVYICSMEQALYNLGLTLKDKLNNVDYEWSYFVANNASFLNVYESTPRSPKRETRGFKDVVVPYAHSLHGKCLRSGYMYKKQKLIKSYTSFFYLLTCNYLHEFKIENAGEENKGFPKKKNKGKVGGAVGPDDLPTKSYNLNDYSISTKNASDFKFVLTKVSNPSQKFTFKCQNEKDFNLWTSELSDLLGFASNHLKRFRFVEENLAMRENSKSLGERSSSVSTTNSDMQLNLNSLLSNKASLQKIKSPALSGIFTPKLQSPGEGEGSMTKNPFDHNFSHILPQSDINVGLLPGVNSPGVSLPGVNSPGVDSPGPTSPLSGSFLPTPAPGLPTNENEALIKHQQEHENYLRLQNEILRQQQQLIDLSVSQSLSRPSLSRNSSSESVLSVLEQTNLGLSRFLDKNKFLMDQSNYSEPLELSSSLSIPTVTVLNHETEQ